MKILPLSLAFSLLGLLPLLSEETSHVHGSLPEQSASEVSSFTLMDQLGYGLATVEDRLVNGKLVTALPVASVFQEQGRTFVITPDEHNPALFERWEVSLGQLDGSYVEALAGIFPGDSVVVHQRKLVPFQGELDKNPSLPRPEVKPSPAPAKSSVPTAVTAAKPAPAAVPAKPVASAAAPAKPVKNFGVQVGAFTKPEAATRVAEQLKPRYGRADILMSESKGRSLYRVRVGEFSSSGAANQVSTELKSSGYPQSFVVGF